MDSSKVDQLCSIIGVNPDKAEVLLREARHSVDLAINRFFSDQLNSGPSLRRAGSEKENEKQDSTPIVVKRPLSESKESLISLPPVPIIAGKDTSKKDKDKETNVLKDKDKEPKSVLDIFIDEKEKTISKTPKKTPKKPKVSKSKRAFSPQIERKQLDKSQEKEIEDNIKQVTTTNQHDETETNSTSNNMSMKKIKEKNKNIEEIENTKTFGEDLSEVGEFDKRKSSRSAAAVGEAKRRALEKQTYRTITESTSTKTPVSLTPKPTASTPKQKEKVKVVTKPTPEQAMVKKNYTLSRTSNINSIQRLITISFTKKITSKQTNILIQFFNLRKIRKKWITQRRKEMSEIMNSVDYKHWKHVIDYRSKQIALKNYIKPQNNDQEPEISPLELLGYTISVCWPSDEEWYEAFIRQYNTHSNRYFLLYKEGFSVEWLDISQEPIPIKIIKKDENINDNTTINSSLVCWICNSADITSFGHGSKSIFCVSCKKSAHSRCFLGSMKYYPSYDTSEGNNTPQPQTTENLESTPNYQLLRFPRCYDCANKCRFCGMGVEISNFISCDVCKSQYHIQCIEDNPTSFIPRENDTETSKYYDIGEEDSLFICSPCLKCRCCQKVYEEDWSLNWMYDGTLCNVCGKQYENLNYCSMCNNIFTQDTDYNSLIYCDLCNRRGHISCFELSSTEMEKLKNKDRIKVTCPLCKLKIYSLEISKLLDRIQFEDKQKIFIERVSDTIAPGYSQIIKIPMDFSTIRFKLNTCLYDNPLQGLKDDLNLVWRNARFYNQPNTLIFKQARRMQQISVRLITIFEEVKKKQKHKIRLPLTSNIISIDQPTPTPDNNILENTDIIVKDSSTTTGTDSTSIIKEESNILPKAWLEHFVFRCTETSHINVECCLLCGCSGDAEDFLFCFDCGEAFHYFCIQPSLRINFQRRSLWRCPECCICEACGTADNVESLLVCDICDQGKHTYCLSPPLIKVPSGGFRCEKCVMCRCCGARSPGKGPIAKWLNNYTMCYACGKLYEQHKFCPVCKIVYRTTDTIPMVCCDGCEQWVHAVCADIDEQGYLRLTTDAYSRYYCTRCQKDPNDLTIEDFPKTIHQLKKLIIRIQQKRRRLRRKYKLDLSRKKTFFTPDNVLTNLNTGEEIENEKNEANLCNSSSNEDSDEEKQENYESEEEAEEEEESEVEEEKQSTSINNDYVSPLKNPNEKETTNNDIDITPESFKTPNPNPNPTIVETNTQKSSKSELEDLCQVLVSVGSEVVHTKTPSVPLSTTPLDSKSNILNNHNENIGTENETKEKSHSLLQLCELLTSIRKTNSSHILLSPRSHSRSHLLDTNSSPLNSIMNQSPIMNHPPSLPSLSGSSSLQRMSIDRHDRTINDESSENENSSDINSENSDSDDNNSISENDYTRIKRRNLKSDINDETNMFAQVNVKDYSNLHTLPNQQEAVHIEFSKLKKPKNYGHFAESFPVPISLALNLPTFRSNNSDISDAITITDTPKPDSTPNNEINEKDDRIGGFQDQRKCILCQVIGDTGRRILGRLLPFDSETWIHIFCALWSSEVYEEIRVGQLKNIQGAITRGKISSCEMCHCFGATVTCCFKKCTKSYHVLCARQAECKFQFDNKTYCPSHSDKADQRKIMHLLDSTIRIKRRFIVKPDKKRQKLEEKAFLQQCIQTEQSSFSLESIPLNHIHIRIGTLSVLHLGTIDTRSEFHFQNQIFPIGFFSTRISSSYRYPSTRVLFTCQILSDGQKPIFKITVSDDLDNAIESDSANKAWNILTSRKIGYHNRNALRKTSSTGNSLAFSLSGPRFFGFGHPYIINLLEQLPNADQCSKYQFHNKQVNNDSPISTQHNSELTLPINPTGCIRTEGYTSYEGKRGRPALLLPPKRISFALDATDVDLDGSKKRKPSTNINPISSISEQSSSAASLLTQFRRMKALPKSYVVGRSKIHQWGVFATQRIEKDSLVVEYCGEIIRKKVADIREKLYQQLHINGLGSCYLFRVDNDTIIDATKKGNEGRFINHSCQPNVFSKLLLVDGQQRIVFISNRVIEPNEELTTDYLFADDDEGSLRCNCGSANCIGRMN